MPNPEPTTVKQEPVPGLRRTNCRFCGGPILFVFTPSGRLRPTSNGRPHSCTDYRKQRAQAAEAAAELQNYLEGVKARGGLTWQTAIPRLHSPQPNKHARADRAVAGQPDPSGTPAA